GLLSTLAGRGPLALRTIATESGLHERYLRETLSALAAGGILQYDPAGETFELTPEVAACLADEKSPFFLGGWTQFLPAVYRAIPGVARAMREGGGVSYAEFGSEAVEAIDRANSPGMRVLLTRKWLPSLPDVVTRLDLVTAFDVVHDLARPRAVLRRIREALAPEGTFFLVEPAAGDSLAENLGSAGALLYSISTLYCMTVSLSQGGEGLGAAYGPKRAEALCRDAGFASFRRLEVENPFNAFYEVRP